MVERFHRQLKAPLKPQTHPDTWMTSLPLVLLGIRTALKQDIKSTAAELVYGTTLRLPGEYFIPSTTPLCPTPLIMYTNLNPTFNKFLPPLLALH